MLQRGLLKVLIILIGTLLLLTSCTTQTPTEPVKLSPAEAMMQKIANLEFDQLGNPQIKTDFIHPVKNTVETPHRLLVIPVEFSNRKFDRFANEPDAPKKNRDYLQQLLFSELQPEPKKNTLSHYYYQQSQGQYFLSGEVLLPVSVNHPSDYYGKPIQNSDGQWRNDVRAELLIEDALLEAQKNNPNFPWQNFDVWDPEDYDKDNQFNEPDGYIDHFVLVFAGGGQSSCQTLYALSDKFNANAPSDLYERLSEKEQECAQRLWPHRFSLTQNVGKGPSLEGKPNHRGGIPLSEKLWVYDYNMQSEYTSISTFIHEFGHSLGLPDIYARDTNNSTASWDLMSSTVGPIPQELSTWSRLMLGWAKPCIILSPQAGGESTQSIYLKTMNDWQTKNHSTSCESALVLLPPKIRELRMGPLAANNGKQAAYTGQGNSLSHTLQRQFDLSTVSSEKIILGLDTWFSIEADWDYLYIEVSDDGENYLRLMPTDKSSAQDTYSVMPSKRGHDGSGTIPGFTGLSGDNDGDGKVESASGCDPDEKHLLAEEKVNATQKSPCENSQWIHADFDLSPFKGKRIFLRFHYYADMAAVEDGALIDNISIPAIDFYEDFEADIFDSQWSNSGFTLSSGSHDIVVPHFYLLEYRDPYALFESGINYDNNLNRPGFIYFPNPDTGKMEAMDFHYQPGTLVWYYNGEYLWSQNEPSQFGPGNGFLLLVDSTPQEYQLPAIPKDFYKDDQGWHYYEFDDNAQSLLKKGFIDVMCFQRRASYYPVDMPAQDKKTCKTTAPPAEQLQFDDKTLLYSYTLINEILPGEPREPFIPMSTLYHYRVSKGEISYRLHDRMLRNAHSADAPFSLRPFEDGIAFFNNDGTQVVQTAVVPFAAVTQFNDDSDTAYLNPHLPFGSTRTANSGFSFELQEPDSEAPEDAQVKINIQWR